MSQEVFTFQADTNQLVSWATSAFYADEGTFLRELVLNASDALDKKGRTERNGIRIEINSINKTITVVDAGVGMTRAELIRKLGDVAGCFRLFSAFMVSSKVTVVTKHNTDGCYKWESMGGGTFTVARTKPRMQTGTRVTCHLRPDRLEYLEKQKLLSVVRLCNVTYRIELISDKKRETVFHKQTLHLWERDPNSVSSEEYRHLYRSTTINLNYLEVKHLVVEGDVSFRAVLFVPRYMPHDPRVPHVQLFANGVFVTDSCAGLVPTWLQFIDGVVNVKTPLLNISRGIHNPGVLATVRQHLVRGCLDMLEANANDSNYHYSYYNSLLYSTIEWQLNEGILLENPSNRARLAGLMRYPSTKTMEGHLTSLADYVTRMKAGQKDIYYVTAVTSPLMERCKREGVEVLFMKKPDDVRTMLLLSNFKNKKLRNLGEAALAFQGIPNTDGDFTPLCETIRKILQGKVHCVILSGRLVQSPCAVSEGHILEINPFHPIVKALNEHITGREVEKLVRLLYETALLVGGLPLEDPCEHVEEICNILSLALEPESF